MVVFPQTEQGTQGAAGMGRAMQHRDVIGSRRVGARWCWVVVGIAHLVLGVPSHPTAQADEIKLGGFWIKDVSIQAIENDHVVYYNRVGTEFARPLETVQGIRIEAYPQLRQAEEAIANGNYRQAQETLLKAYSKARSSWLKQWVGHLLVGVYDHLGMAREAVDLFLRLAREGAPLFYLSHPPIESLLQLENGVKVNLRKQIRLTIEYMTGRPEAGFLEQWLQRIDLDNTPVKVELGHNGDGNDTPESGVETAVVQPRVTLARALDIADPITVLLANNQFEQALSQVNALIAKDNRNLSARLYQRGLAQMGLALASDDQDHYLDAGLSFMRVVAYFPFSSYAGPSLVEAGWIHSKIGQAEIAERLYARAAPMIENQEDPRYAARLQQLIEEID